MRWVLVALGVLKFAWLGWVWGGLGVALGCGSRVKGLGGGFKAVYGAWGCI